MQLWILRDTLEEQDSTSMVGKRIDGGSTRKEEEARESRRARVEGKKKKETIEETGETRGRAQS